MTARGIRNNNPGNIEHTGTPWQGLADPPSDGRFCRFVSMPYGVRAMARTLITYQDKHGIRTVRGHIGRWAPPTENKTTIYARHVAGAVGVEMDTPIDVHDYGTLRPMIEAMIEMECGRNHGVTAAQIDKGLALAGIEPPAKPLASSRTVKGAQTAAAGVGLSAAAEALQSLQAQLGPLVAYADVLKWLFLAVALVGIAVTVYARWDDARRLAR